MKMETARRILACTLPGLRLHRRRRPRRGGESEWKNINKN